MPFYPPDPRRIPPSTIYRQRVGYPHQMRRQEDFFFQPPQIRRQNNPSSYPNQTVRQEQHFSSPPYQQQQFSRLGRLPGQLNTIMGHVGTVTSGVNTIKQIGSFLRLLR